MTATAKAFEFPVSVRWLAGRRTLASVPGRHDLEVATPPEFKGGVEGVWSPEDLVVGAIASCFTVTLLAVAERRGLPLRGLEVHGSGRVTQRDDGRFGFTGATLHVRLDTDPGCEAEAEVAAEVAEQGCLVTASLDFPVHVELDVRSAPLLEAAF
jgi:organic hydroperoxide reductase OsmC/OhrA